MGKLHIVSRSDQRFRDREEAGRLLGEELKGWRGKHVVVLGIPRGGVVVARELARALEAEMDVVLVRKLTTPGYPELAMGSVSEDGHVFLNHEVVGPLGITTADIDREKERQLAVIRQRAELFRGARPRVLLEGRVVIVTDDGVATGATTRAALWAVRTEKPQTLIAAMPTGPEDEIRRLAEDVDEMICLRVPPFFGAVAQSYRLFYPVEDEEVLRILREEAESARQPQEAK